MKVFHIFAAAIGYAVIALWLAGTLGIGDFSLHFGPAGTDDTARYTCTSGDSIWTRKKYDCSFREWVKQRAAEEEAEAKETEPGNDAAATDAHKE